MYVGGKGQIIPHIDRSREIARIINWRSAMLEKTFWEDKDQVLRYGEEAFKSC